MTSWKFSGISVIFQEFLDFWEIFRSISNFEKYDSLKNFEKTSAV
jgi:hypothetical protein